MKRSLENPDIGGRIILKLILKKQSWRIRTGFVWLRIRTSGGCLI
jgi:hypothetical protein